MDYQLRLKGFVGGWDFDSDYTQYILDKHAGQPVAVCIDSMGGKLNTALSISAAFKAHGDVTVHYVAMNASAATIASLGARKVTMDRDAWYLVHKASFNICEYADMNSDDIEAFIKDLEKAKAQLLKYDLGIAEAYARRCKKSPEELYELMKQETFLSAKEALEWGFIDEITDYEEDSKPVLDEATAKYCNDNGIAIPQALMKYMPAKESFVDRIVASIKSAFSPNDKIDMNRNEKNDPVSQDPKNVTAPEGGQASNESEELLALRAERDALMKEKEELMAKLDKKPAEQHKSVVDDKPEAKNVLRSNLTRKSARDLFNSLP